MNVLAIIGFARKGIGGVESLLNSIVAGREKAQFNFHVIYLYSKKCPINVQTVEGLKAAGASVVLMSTDLRNFLKINRYVRECKIQLILTNQLRADLFGSIAARLNHKPCVINRQAQLADFPVSSIKKNLYYLVDRISTHLTTRIIVPTFQCRETMSEIQRVERSKIVVIRNGIDLEMRYRIQQSSDIAVKWQKMNDEKIVSIFAQLTKSKAHEYFVASMPRILSKLPRTKFLLVGDGPERAKIKRQVEELSLGSNVVFYGYAQYPEEYLALMNTVDVVCLTSVREAFPLVILDAVALGKPVVVTDVGGIREFVLNGLTGFLVPPRQSDAFAEGVIEALTNVDHTVTMTNAAHQKLQEGYTTQAMIHNYSELFRSLCK